MRTLLPDMSDFQRDSRLGSPRDLQFLEEDKWLLDTEVRYFILEKRRRWQVFMLFISVENPYRFLCKFIDDYNTKNKAQNYADILQRGIRKDARGTLKTNEYDFHICYN